MLEIQDTAGSEQFKNHCDAIYRDSDGFIVMYAIDSRATFGMVSELIDKAHLAKGYNMDEPVPMEDVPIFVVGNKVDLADSRSVTTEEGRSLCEKWKIPDEFFIESSAKANLNVKETFVALANQCAKNWASKNTGGPSGGGTARRCLLL